MQPRIILRSLAQRPGFAAVALVSLALGIGANTAIFSVMDALLLRRLPVERPEELVWFGPARARGVASGFPSGDVEMVSPAFYDKLRQESRSFASLTAFFNLPVELYGRLDRVPEPLKLQVRLVDGHFFSTLGLKPALGRALTESDDRRNAAPVMILSEALWEQRFGRSPEVVGRTMTAQGIVFTIAGVAPRGFHGLEVGQRADAYVALAWQPELVPWAGDPREPLQQFLHVVGRRGTGVTVAQAQAEANRVFQQWLREVDAASPAPDHARDMKTARVTLMEAGTGVSELRAEFQAPLRILLVVVGLVLLIACANLANLLLARAASRRREFAMRVAVGASRGQLMLHSLGESVALALGGGALGLLLAWWGAQWLLTLVTVGPEPIALEVGPNWRVAGFLTALSLVTGLVFGALPAWRASRTDAGPALHEGKGAAADASAGGWLGHALVAGQVALALVLTAGAGLFLRTLMELSRVNTGFDQRVLNVSFDLRAAGLRGPAADAFAARLEERVRAIPGVQTTAYTQLRYNGGRIGTRVFRAGAPRVRANAIRTDASEVSIGYFETMGIPILEGRGFARAQDGPQAPKAIIVSQALARLIDTDGSVVGRVIQDDEGRDLRIIGVSGNVNLGSMREKKPAPIFYAHDPAPGGHLLIRAPGDPARYWSAVREAIRAENPNVPVTRMATVGEFVAETLVHERVLAQLASLFGLLALGLAAIGLYGVLAYRVARRTAEIGLRMALGARPEQVLAGVLRESGVVVGAGLLLGTPAVLVAGRWIQDRLFGLDARDPVTLALAAGLLLVVGLGAALVPAWRASRLDPVRALRQS